MIDKRKWHDIWSFNIPEIDQQHQALYDIINQIGDAIDLKHPKTKILEHLQKLVDQCRLHFEHEETFMRSMHYKGYHAHKTEHAMLLAETTNIIRNIKNNKVDINPALYLELKHWLIAHITQSDKDYADHYTKNK